MTEIVALDNLVLGSTPNAYAMQPAAAGTTMAGELERATSPRGTTRYAPLSFFSTTQGPPTAGVNGYDELDQREARVGRVHDAPRPAPLRPHAGQLGSRHGRRTRGDGIDSDYQTTLDRIMFVTGHQVDGPVLRRRVGLRLHRADQRRPPTTCTAASRTTPATSATSTSGRRSSRTARTRRSRGSSWLAATSSSTAASTRRTARSTSTWPPGRRRTPTTTRPTRLDNGLEPRRAWAFTRTCWVQMLWRKFRFEAEAATINGQIGSYPTLGQNLFNPTGIREYGLVTQTEFRAVEDKLDLQFGFGWASGDPYANNPQPERLREQLGPERYPLRQDEACKASTRTPMTRWPTSRRSASTRTTTSTSSSSATSCTQIEGAYYFRPSVDYDFLRHAERREVRRRRGGHLEPREPVHPDAGARARPRRRARRSALLPVEGRLAERRPDQDRWLLRDAPVRRLLPARGPQLPSGRDVEPPERGPVYGSDDSALSRRSLLTARRADDRAL